MTVYYCLGIALIIVIAMYVGNKITDRIFNDQINAVRDAAIIEMETRQREIEKSDGD